MMKSMNLHHHNETMVQTIPLDHIQKKLQKFSSERKAHNEAQIWLSKCEYCNEWQSTMSSWSEPYWTHKFCTYCEEWKILIEKWKKQPEQQSKMKSIEMEKIERLLKKSGVWPRFKEKKLSDLQNKKWLFWIAKKYCDNRNEYNDKWWWLYLWGKRWTWKTHTATAIANQLIEQYLTKVMFINIAEVASRVKKTFWSSKKEPDWNLFEEIKDVELLVIDDIWLENISWWLNEQVYLLINYRYEQMKPIIITSNQSLEDLEKIHKPQVCSRLKQMCKIIQFSGEDMRESLRPDF